jgi:hypothetical protein
MRGEINLDQTRSFAPHRILGHFQQIRNVRTGDGLIVNPALDGAKPKRFYPPTPVCGGAGLTRRNAPTAPLRLPPDRRRE